MMAKAGRPKSLRPHNIKLQLPKTPLKYKAKRLYWAMMEMEKKMSRDITSVRMADYNTVLSAFIEVTEQLAKQGIKYERKDPKQGMVEQGLVQNSESSGETEVSGDRSAGVGSGISPFDPFA